MRPLMPFALLAGAAAFALPLTAQTPRPAPRPPALQKQVSFFTYGDPAVPDALKGPVSKLPDGALQAWSQSAAGAAWVAVRHGLIRFNSREKPNNQVQFFASRRYLPDDEVQAVWVDPKPAAPAVERVWARTRTGVSRIDLVPMTLEAKADLFEKRVRDRHDRYGQVADSHLKVAGDLSSNQMVSNDNDGLWTAMYVGGKLFEYAVRKNPAALEAAKKSIEAVLFLEQVTGRPGFPARSFLKKGDPEPRDGEWHDSPDGKWRWKGDTSSDEIVGHFFLFGLAWDLLPPSEQALRDRVAATARRILDHIIEHRYHLVDVDGQPTRWGKWSWEYFRSPGGIPDSPLNALEILSFLKTAHHITGDEKYAREYRRLAIEEKYLAQAQRYLELREEINYSDEELAMLPFYMVFRYEKDPEYLKQYRNALDQWWANAQREKNPLWTFIYQYANPGAKVDLEGAIWTLERIPLDLIKWSYDNTKRADIELEPGLDRFRRPQAKNLLPADERAVMKWNGNPFRLDGGAGGSGEDDGGFYILAYWIGRYQRYL